MPIALTRPVSRTLDQCALTYLDREPIDVARAAAQHERYVEVLRDLGAEVVVMPEEPELPDAVFVEDTVVAVEEVAVMSRPALPSRQEELPSAEAVLRCYRPIERISGEGTLEGGDVLRLGRTLYVGLTPRTNRCGIEQLAAILGAHGYEIRAVEVTGCLHLKSAITDLGDGLLLANPDWLDMTPFVGWEVVSVDPAEPHAANALRLGDGVIFPANFPRTAQRIEARGLRVCPVDVSELQKAEAGVTCCSVILA
jgi:dimethylargininase